MLSRDDEAFYGRQEFCCWNYSLINCFQCQKKNRLQRIFFMTILKFNWVHSTLGLMVPHFSSFWMSSEQRKRHHQTQFGPFSSVNRIGTVYSVLTEAWYGLDDRGSRVRFPAGAGNFSLHYSVQNGSGAHPTSYPMGTRGSFPGGKAAGAWSWPLTSI
jgi:hypothetical protein